MTEQRFVIQVQGRLPAHSVDAAMRDSGSCRIDTLLRLAVRDQAALNGLLRRLEDLGLNLVEFRRLSSTSADARPIPVEVLLAGSIGDLAASMLEDQAQIVALSTRVAFSDQNLMDQTLARIVSSGAEVEHTTGSGT